MAITLTACKANTRGKSTREITYMGIGKLVVEQVPVKDDDNKTVKGKDGKAVTEPKESLDSKGVVTTPKEAVELHNGNLQEMLDTWAEGYNARSLRLASDQLAQYIDSKWTKEQKDSFRLAANNLIKMNPDKFEEAVKIATMFANKS